MLEQDPEANDVISLGQNSSPPQAVPESIASPDSLKAEPNSVAHGLFEAPKASEAVHSVGTGQVKAETADEECLIRLGSVQKEDSEQIPQVDADRSLHGYGTEDQPITVVRGSISGSCCNMVASDETLSPPTQSHVAQTAVPSAEAHGHESQQAKLDSDAATPCQAVNGDLPPTAAFITMAGGASCEPQQSQIVQLGVAAAHRPIPETQPRRANGRFLPRKRARPDSTSSQPAENHEPGPSIAQPLEVMTTPTAVPAELWSGPNSPRQGSMLAEELVSSARVDGECRKNCPSAALPCQLQTRRSSRGAAARHALPNGCMDATLADASQNLDAVDGRHNGCGRHAAGPAGQSISTLRCKKYCAKCFTFFHAHLVCPLNLQTYVERDFSYLSCLSRNVILISVL